MAVPLGEALPPRLPPRVASPCSVASQVLWPHPTSHPLHARRPACRLPEPARHTRPGMDETSQVPRNELLHVHKVSDCARFFPCKPVRHGTMLPSLQRKEIGTPNQPVSQLNTWPGFPCERFTVPSRAEPRASLGVGVVGKDLSPVGTCTSYSLPASWRTPVLGQKRKWPCLNGMSVLPPRADLVSPARHVRFVPKPEMKVSQAKRQR